MTIDLEELERLGQLPALSWDEATLVIEALPYLTARVRKLEAALQAFMPELEERERFIEAQDSQHTDKQIATLKRIAAARAALSPPRGQHG